MLLGWIDFRAKKFRIEFVACIVRVTLLPGLEPGV